MDCPPGLTGDFDFRYNMGSSMTSPFFTFVNILVFVVGVIIGTQLAWYFQIMLLLAGWAYLNHMTPRLKLGIFILIIPYIVFIAGLIVGDINWFIQTGSGGVNFGSFFNLFIAK